jgi:hypothetical protein
VKSLNSCSEIPLAKRRKALWINQTGLLCAIEIVERRTRPYISCATGGIDKNSDTVPRQWKVSAQRDNPYATMPKGSARNTIARSQQQRIFSLKRLMLQLIKVNLKVNLYLTPCLMRHLFSQLKFFLSLRLAGIPNSAGLLFDRVSNSKGISQHALMDYLALHSLICGLTKVSPPRIRTSYIYCRVGVSYL